MQSILHITSLLERVVFDSKNMKTLLVCRSMRDAWLSRGTSKDAHEHEPFASALVESWNARGDVAGSLRRVASFPVHSDAAWRLATGRPRPEDEDDRAQALSDITTAVLDRMTSPMGPVAWVSRELDVDQAIDMAALCGLPSVLSALLDWQNAAFIECSDGSSSSSSNGNSSNSSNCNGNNLIDQTYRLRKWSTCQRHATVIHAVRGGNEDTVLVLLHDLLDTMDDLSGAEEDITYDDDADEEDALFVDFNVLPVPPAHEADADANANPNNNGNGNADIIGEALGVALEDEEDPYAQCVRAIIHAISSAFMAASDNLRMLQFVCRWAPKADPDADRVIESRNQNPNQYAGSCGRTWRPESPTCACC